MSPQKIRILFLGASLVAGYSSLGAVYHPFSQNVVKMLSMVMPGTEIETVVDGVPGDLVTRGTFLKRMQKHCGRVPFYHPFSSKADCGRQLRGEMSCSTGP